MSRSAYVQCCYDALRQAFEDIDQLAELADHLKDQRKYQEIIDCTAATNAWPGADDSEIYSIALIDGLDPRRVREAITFGGERAQIAREYRAKKTIPKFAFRPVKRPPAHLEMSTLMALDWMIAGERWGELEQFCEGKSAEEIELIRQYVKKRSGEKHGRQSR